MKYNIVIARTDAKLFEFFFEKKANGQDSKEVEVGKVIPFDDIIILNEIEVKSVKIKTQALRTDYIKVESNTNTNANANTKEKGESEFGISIEGKIIPTLGPVETTFEILGETKKAVGDGLKYDNISKHDLEALRDGFKINKNALEDIPGMISKVETGISNALSLLSSTTELQNKLKNMWLKPLNNSVLNINNLKEWAECYGEYSKTKEPLDSPKAGEEVAEEKLREEDKKGNLQDYRDVLLLIKISDAHTLSYKFKDLFIGDYQEEYSEAEGVGTYKLELKQKLRARTEGRFTVKKTGEIEEKLGELRAMIKEPEEKTEETGKDISVKETGVMG
ncbi:MAG: hypothetical protein ACRC6K_00015 [Fusobacteriaceae bacterium]